MATRKGRINRGYRTFVDPEHVAYFYAKQLVTAFDLAPDNPAYYEVGVPMPGGHNRYEVRINGLSEGSTWRVSVDTSGYATQTGDASTDTGWTIIASELGASDSVTFGEGPDLGVIKAGVFSAIPAQSIVGFRIDDTGGDPYGAIVAITGVSVRGAVA